MTVAKPLPHDAAPLHVTGQARYVDDIPVPANCLHLAFGLSTIAHGEITSINLDAVRAAPGIIAVLTADDLPFANDVSPSIHDEPLLATGTVHYVGQPIFMVVAETHLAARKAARLGRIEYSELPALLSIEDALEADSRFEDGPVIWSKGDAGAALKGAKNRLQGSITMGGQEHFYLEGQAALALPQEGGDMLVHSSTQHPTEIQHKVAEAIGTPMNAVRVETRRMGGGFGGKESQGNALAVGCAVAARLTGRPCKMRYDRDDDMIITGKRHDFRIDYDVGFDDEGRIAGIDFLQYTRCGWAQDLSLPVADRAMLHSDNAYNLPAARIESHRLKTNMQSATAYRGFGGPQGMLAIERVLDHIAHAVGRDPYDVRRVNFYADAAPETADKANPETDEGRGLPGDTSADLASRGAPPVAGDPPAPPKDAQTTPYHMAVEDFILNRLCDKLEQTSDYRARRKAVATWNAQNEVLKKGIALTPVKFGISFTLTHLNQAGALVHVYQDGSIHMNHGGTEMGQGLFQKVAQVAASSFGVGLDKVKITATDTAKVPNTSATAASSGSDLNGMAVKAACDTIRERIADFIGQRYQTRAIRFADGLLHVGNETLTFTEAVKLAYENRVSLSATGFYKTPKIEWNRVTGKGRPFYYFAYGAAVTECVIDTLTGENRILRTDILHDVGLLAEPRHRHRPDRGRLRPGRGLADDRGTGLGRQGQPSHPRALDLQDSRLLGPARYLQRRTVRWPQPRRHHLSFQSRWRTALHAGHFGVDGTVGRSRRLRARLSVARRARHGRTHLDHTRPGAVMSLDLQALREAISKHGRVVRVVVAEIAGSVPREVGASMLVWEDGQSGTIGGGALEFEAAKRARSIANDRTDRVPLGPAMGQCCGGAVTLVSEIFDTRRLNDIADTHFLRSLGGSPDVPLAIQRRLAEARNSGTPVPTMFQSGWLVEPVATATRQVWIFGAGHVGRAIVSVLHPLTGFELTWIDTAADRFPETIPHGVTRLIAENPADLMKFAPAEAEHLILTYSHALDLELCHRLLSHGFRAAGLIGSRTKWARFRSRLRQLGHDEAQITRIRCPIGQPHLGKEPQAIAIGVAAELISQQQAQTDAERNRVG